MGTITYALEQLEGVNGKGYLDLQYAQEILTDLGLSTEIPPELLISYQNREEFDAHFKGEYYLCDDRAGSSIELPALTQHICTLLGIDSPSKHVTQKQIIVKLNTIAIKQRLTKLGLL